MIKANDKWIELDSSIDADSTKPLKGVDRTEETASSSSSSPVPYSDFSPSLEESDGTYTSVATQKVKYSYWFADDTANSTARFKFDQKKGWEIQDKAELSDTKTDWKLNGKTFAYSDAGGSLSEGAKNASAVFGDLSGDTANATYTIGFSPRKEESYGTEYHAVDLKGSASGALSHEFSEGSFKVQLNDQGNSVTIALSGSDTSTKTSAGQGTVHTLNGDVVTKTVYTGNKYNEKTFSLSYAQFEEKTAA